MFDPFGIKKRHKQIMDSQRLMTGNLDYILDRLDEIDRVQDIMSSTLQKVLDNQRLYIDYFNELNRRLVEFVDRITMIKAEMTYVRESLMALSKVVDTEKLINLGEVANELKRIVKVVDLLNDTIHEKILNEATNLDDITQ